jgi:ACR3 family arsenite efflux pump ArsB
MLNKKFLMALNLFNHSAFLLIFAIITGALLGVASPDLGNKVSSYIDPTILLLIFLLLFEVPLKGIFKGATNIRFIAIAWIVNFLVIPVIGFTISSLFLSGEALFYTGLVIYFMASCTDWYLGFTRLAKGNVELGAALLPINMITQLILFPVYLLIFDTMATSKVDLNVLFEWFLQPLIAAAILRIFCGQFINKLLHLCDVAIPLVLAVLVCLIFMSNINPLLAHLSVVPLLLLAIFSFFTITYALGEIIAKGAKLAYPEHCLFTFTTGARNAPLMLGLTTIAIPEQPLIYATITIGMLIEFPHLITLKAILLKRQKTKSACQPSNLKC